MIDVGMVRMAPSVAGAERVQEMRSSKAKPYIFIQYKSMDWSALEGFEWDAGNERKSELKHAVSAAEAEQVFFNQPMLVRTDAAHSALEPRWHALGITDAGRFLHITFTLRAGGRLIRVISARDMHRKERIVYAKAS